MVRDLPEGLSDRQPLRLVRRGYEVDHEGYEGGELIRATGAARDERLRAGRAEKRA